MKLGTGLSLLLEVEHKNSEDTSFTTLIGFASITAVGVYTQDGSGIKGRAQYTLRRASRRMHIASFALAPWRVY